MVSQGQVLSLTYRRQLDVGDMSQWCYAPGECVSTEPMIPVALVLVTGLVTLLVAVALVHVDDAWPLLEEERERTRAERAAFREFARRVESLEASTPRAPAGAVGAVPSLEAKRAGRGLEEVKDAYEETVMSVSHYDEEYDEPLEANMMAELSADVAAGVSEGTTLTPPLKSALAGTSREAVTKRDELLRRLDREAAALKDAETRLGDVEAELERAAKPEPEERSFDQLLDAWDALGDLEARCRAVLSDRQQFVHGSESRTDDGPSIQEYLYRPLDVDYPVLAAGADMMDRIDRSRQGIEAALARRP